MAKSKVFSRLSDAFANDFQHYFYTKNLMQYQRNNKNIPINIMNKLTYFMDV